MRFWPLVLWLSLLSSPARSNESLKTAAELPTIQFSRHVVAVFSRLGCNGGACHGAVQGQNGFRLSLFGARPEQDYEQIVHQHGGRRLDRLLPQQSLLLLKATAETPHRGGRRLRVGSVEYQVLRRWIEAGVPLDEPATSQLVTLEALPLQQDAHPGESYAMQVIGRFADGSVEDVTSLCSYESLDEGVATVDSNGRVQAAAWAPPRWWSASAPIRSWPESWWRARARGRWLLLHP